MTRPAVRGKLAPMQPTEIIGAPAFGDTALVAALREGDERAFTTLVERYQAPMLRLAAGHVPSRAIAEEVVQETWLAVLSGLDRFEARSSLKTWIFRILVNRAISRGRRERRSVPMSMFEDDDGGPTVDAGRFLGDDHPRWPGHWAASPASWEAIPDEKLLGREARELVSAAIARLPSRQQQVMVLRDVEGWEAGEVCDALELSEANQRVLLHRARAKVRKELAAYFGDEAE
jgi:RNA polymerase sigma-70 factor, ECF subfamily